jgi:hypothetical protein
MSGQIEQSVHVGDRDMFGPILHLYDFVTGTDLTFLQDTKVKSWSMMCHEKRWHPGLVHADANPITCNARLSYFEDGTADSILIAYADFIVEKPFDGEILSKLPEGKIVAFEKAFPIPIRFDLVNKNGAMLPAVTVEISLSIAVDIEFAYNLPAFYGRFPDCRPDSPAIPWHLAGKTDVYREQPRHRFHLEITCRVI